MTSKRKRRKATTKELAEIARAQAELDPPTFGPVTVDWDPEFLEIDGRHYSVRELAEAVKAQRKPKRGPGRKPIPNKSAILDAAALAKVRTGTYLQIARDWNLSKEQLMNMVRNNSRSFRARLKDLRKKRK